MNEKQVMELADYLGCNGGELWSELKPAFESIEKSYGGCHICYGKGYSTVNGQWAGHDTDTDIGSRGGIVRGGKAVEMKYCTCARGKQLESLLESA